MVYEWKVELELRKGLDIINYLGLVVENFGTVDL